MQTSKPLRSTVLTSGKFRQSICRNHYGELTKMSERERLGLLERFILSGRVSDRQSGVARLDLASGELSAVTQSRSPASICR